MGNCSLKGIAGNITNPIRIMTDSGGVIEYKGLIKVGNVISDFPGYGVFREGRFSSPLFYHEQLFSSHLYYLLPLVVEKERSVVVPADDAKDDQVIMKELDLEELGSRFLAPVRVSSASRGADIVKDLKTEQPAHLEVLPSMGNGVWRVKLVIDTKQLEEILSEQVNIGDLIEKMRMVASSASTSAATTPKRSKVSWLQGVGRSRPSFSSVFKVSPTDCR